MIYQFITTEDIIQQIKQDLLFDIIPEAERENKIKKAENIAIKQVKSKAGKWYDFDSVIFSIPQWIETDSYPIDKIVYFNGYFYNSIIENNLNNSPEETNTLAWKKIEDPRHSLLVMYIVDIMIYHLHSSVNPRKIPDLRKERYNEAKKWMEDIAKSSENADFPSNILDDERIIWGSNKKIDNYF